jgi:NADH:ubiquinone oxidoreductase subunit 6 (subunit J)
MDPSQAVEMIKLLVYASAVIVVALAIVALIKKKS